MKKIFVHIGLPKTATTSLQTDLFPFLAGENIEYLGVFQPRESFTQSEFYRDFLKAVGGEIYITEFREALYQQLARKTLILSEEMISVSWDWISWRMKLANLGEVLEGFEYEIIVTVREPEAAMFSYYCEMYPRHGNWEHSFIDCALQNEAMQIFHYDKLIGELMRHFARERLHFFKFEDLVANGARDITKLVMGDAFVEVPLGNHNQRSKTKRHVVTPYDLTISDQVCRVFPRLLQFGKKITSKWPSPLLSIGRRIGDIKIGHLTIRRPKPHEMLKLRQSLVDGNRVLNQEFGLKY